MKRWASGCRNLGRTAANCRSGGNLRAHRSTLCERSINRDGGTLQPGPVSMVVLASSARAAQGCSKVRPVEGRSCSAALKSEDRRPKPERRPNSEFREWPGSIGCCSAGVAINSDLGLRVSFGLRSSGLGFGVARTDFRAALSGMASVCRFPLGHQSDYRPATV